MSIVKKNWSADVMAALDLVREEVVKATRQIQETGGAEMSRGNMALAKKAIGYIDKLDEFMMQVEGVGEKWAKDILLAQIFQSSIGIFIGLKQISETAEPFADQIKVASTGFRKARFYPPSKVSLTFAGKKYYLSCEFSPGALTPVVAWLEGKGMSKKQICELVK